MSTLATAVFNEEDENNDFDYVPEERPDTDDEKAAATSAIAQESTDGAKDGGDPAKELAEKERARQMLWASFQSSVITSNASTSIPSKAPSLRLVKIMKTHRFAGADVTEIVEVPEDSAEARKWPRWQPPTQDVSKKEEVVVAKIQNPPAASPTLGPSTPEEPRAALESTSSYLSPSHATRSKSLSPPPSTTPRSSHLPSSSNSKPRPRKPRTVLLADPLPGTAAPKKLTMLQKSALDWQAHVYASPDVGFVPAAVDGAEGAAAARALAEELERNRRSGGYLERVAFLDRVGTRREDLFEEGRLKRRRKG